MKVPWMEMSLRDFQSALASSSPTPGGGTAAAIALGQASALTIMVADLTIGKEKWESGWDIFSLNFPWMLSLSPSTTFTHQVMSQKWIFSGARWGPILF